ncbi:hypothetical protein B0H13DRAFT_1905495 [Mycena leptocephala]|nr:hypothetical protein B0H13DRAFT_1905495 [Mycena leptocephala]
MCHRIRTDNPKCASLLWIPGIKEIVRKTNGYDARASSLFGLGLPLAFLAALCALASLSSLSALALALGRPHPHPPSHLTNPPPRAPLLRAVPLARPPLPQRAPARVASCRIDGKDKGAAEGGAAVAVNRVFQAYLTADMLHRCLMLPGADRLRRRLGKGGRMCFVCVRLWSHGEIRCMTPFGNCHQKESFSPLLSLGRSQFSYVIGAPDLPPKPSRSPSSYAHRVPCGAYLGVCFGGDLCFVDVGRLLRTRLPPLIPSFTRRDFHGRARTGTSLCQDVGGDGYPSVSVSAHLAFDAQPGANAPRTSRSSQLRGASVPFLVFRSFSAIHGERLPFFLAVARAYSHQLDYLFRAASSPLRCHVRLPGGPEACEPSRCEDGIGLSRRDRQSILIVRPSFHPHPHQHSATSNTRVMARWLERHLILLWDYNFATDPDVLIFSRPISFSYSNAPVLADLHGAGSSQILNHSADNDSGLATSIRPSFPLPLDHRGDWFRSAKPAPSKVAAEARLKMDDIWKDVRDCFTPSVQVLGNRFSNGRDEEYRTLLKVNPFDSIHSNSTRNNVLESGRDHPQRERTHSRKVRRIRDLLNVGNAQMVQFKSIVSTGNRNDAIALATNIPV